MKHYWDKENKFESYNNLLLDKPVTLRKAEFDNKNKLVFKTEQTILFYDAERILLVIGIVCLMFLVGILV